ncbi:electron transport complex subunit E [bacterium]|nr:electron transport complex subunit E [bacterium]
MSVLNDFLNGFWNENPVFRLVLGMCATMAITTQAINGIGMGLAATFVLVCSNFVVSVMRKIIPEKVRLAVFIVVIATFVTIVDLVMEGFFYEIHKALGVFIPLIVVNCIIIARAEAFASKYPVINSIADGLGMGLGFTISITVLGMIRELLGNGTIFGITIFSKSYQAFLLALIPGGAFIALGLLLGMMNKINEKLGYKG